MNLFRRVIPILLGIGMAAMMTFAGVTLTRAEATEVWVDNDWAGSSPGDTVDGHIFGSDAFAMIQGGIDAVASLGTVHVGAGTYYENITLKDGVQVLGAGADVTIIDGGGAGSVVTAIGVGSETILDGFTITNGSADRGGGIYCDISSPTISNNKVIHNHASRQYDLDYGGGGIYCGYGSNAKIVNNIIEDNSANASGGGIFFYLSSPTIESNLIIDNAGALEGGNTQGGGIAGYRDSTAIICNNLIISNSAVTLQLGVPEPDYEVGGGGIALDHHANAVIVNNTIDGNSTVYGYGGGIFCDWNTSPIIRNNIITNSPDGEGIWASSVGAEPIIDYNNIWNNADGNYGGTAQPGESDISADPVFVDTAGGDYHLQAGSPCIDSGTNEGAPTEDIEGNPRPIDGDGDCIAVTDMGAYEYVPAPTTWHVDDDLADYPAADFTKIQDAVDAADAGDTIKVYSGIYYEVVDVNKQLVLQGVDTGGGKPVADAGGYWHAIRLKADAITLEGFKATNTDSSWGNPGIYVTSDNNTITGNAASNNDYGIYVYYSNNNTITGNTASNNNRGIYLYCSNNNTITGNSPSNNNYGIYLDQSGSNTLRNNLVSDNGCNFGAWGGSYSNYDNDIDTSNLVDGKPIYYLVDVSGAIIDSSSNAGTVYCINCDNVTVKDLTLTNNFKGIYFHNTSNSTIENNHISSNECGISLAGSTSNTITGNIASHNNGTGISLGYSSNNNIITGNTASNNQSGIYLGAASNNVITGNTASSNHSGIYLSGSGNNKIYLNNFITNSPYNASFYFSTNIWNSTEPTMYQYNGSTFTNYMGNYWSDYGGSDADGDGIGDTPYSIESDEDNYPLVEPFENYEILRPSVSIQPTNPIVSPGATFAVDVWVDAAGRGLAGIDVAVEYDSGVMTTSEDDIDAHNLLGGLELGPEVDEAGEVGEVSYQVARADTVADISASVMTIQFTVDEGAETDDYPLSVIKADLTDGTAIFEDTLLNDGMVTIRRKGDFDGNDDIDIFDFVQFAIAYGSELGDENYNRIGDFNDDACINILDFVGFAAVYGT